MESDFLADLDRTVMHAMRTIGAPERDVGAVAQLVRQSVRAEWGGVRVRIPTSAEVPSDFELANAARGASHRQVCARYGISKGSLGRALQRVRATRGSL